jgi:hypothetical protein
MGEVLGLGISHYPGFIYPDSNMAMRVKQTMTSPKVPEPMKEPRNRPAPMQEEWGDDKGTMFAAKHREQFVGGVRKARAAIDEFNPDFVVSFGDDQYENFREDIIPPFCIYIAEEFQTKPFLRGRGGAPQPNIWEESYVEVFVTKGHRQAAKYLATQLLESGFDMPYAYTNLHHEGLGHAFMNTVLYLDYH